MCVEMHVHGLYGIDSSMTVSDVVSYLKKSGIPESTALYLKVSFNAVYFLLMNNLLICRQLYRWDGVFGTY